MTYHNFDSVADLLNAMRQPCAVAYNERMARNFDSGERGWMCADRRHIQTFAQADAAFAETSFPAGVARIERMASQIEMPTPVSIKRRVVRSDAGDELDMQRVWQGDLDRAWSVAKRQHSVSASRVLVCVFVGAPGSESSEDVAWRGVAGLALADALEAAGYTVEIRAMRRAHYCSRSSERHDVDVTVKPAGEPLDVHKAASLIATTLFFRGALLRHACVVAEHTVDPGITSTSYERSNDVQNAGGFDYVCVADKSIAGSASASRWIATQTKALDVLNSGVV